MRKIIFLLFMLLILNALSFSYLYILNENRTVFSSFTYEKPLIIQNKELILDDIESFKLDDYFTILCNEQYSYKYEFNDESLIICLNYECFYYDYSLREPEIIETIIEKEVIKEVYINTVNNQKTEKEESDNSINNEHGDYEYENDYFILKTDYCCFPCDTDLNTIIQEIQNYVETNKRITVDYSQLNPSQNGYYSVYFITNDAKYELIVEIS